MKRWSVFYSHVSGEVRMTEVRKGHNAKELAIQDREDLLAHSPHLDPSQCFVATVETHQEAMAS